MIVLIATATDLELARALQSLKVENRILRDRLPQTVRVTPLVRRQLHEFAIPVGWGPKTCSRSPLPGPSGAGR
ncbi:MAG: hypothetical protein KDA75_19935 [Planctomycetaceae bacterium]|nr:hypothetical protein [Planctomycetaceae bacterium]